MFLLFSQLFSSYQNFKWFWLVCKKWKNFHWRKLFPRSFSLTAMNSTQCCGPGVVDFSRRSVCRAVTFGFQTAEDCPKILSRPAQKKVRNVLWWIFFHIWLQLESWLSAIQNKKKNPFKFRVNFARHTSKKDCTQIKAPDRAAKWYWVIRNYSL